MSDKGLPRELSHYSDECVMCHEQVEVTTLDEFRRCRVCRKQLLDGKMQQCINCDEWTTDWRTYVEGSYMCLLCTEARGEGEWA